MASTSLPQTEAEHLVALRNDLPRLRARVVSLHNAGWTFRAIGEPLGSPRSTVRAWFVEGQDLTPDTDPCPRPPVAGRPAPPVSSHARTRSLRPDVPVADRAKIARLAPLARRVRGGTNPTSAYALAKVELDELVLHHFNRGVSRRRLAQLAGVTYRAMSVRLEAAKTHAA